LKPIEKFSVGDTLAQTMTNSLGLDISTTCVGVCLVDGSKNVLHLNAIKIPAELSMFDKADFVLKELNSVVGSHKLGRVIVEGHAKAFSKGFTSADTLFTLAKFNGLVSYLCWKQFGVVVTDVNVSSARKAVGFKNTKADKRPVKEKVFEFVTATHPDLPWKKYVPKAGKNKGVEVYTPEMRDAADAWVIVMGAH